MIIVDKSNPKEAVKQINKAALIRLRRRKEITSNSTEEHVTILLSDLHSSEQWLICDCRPDLDIQCAPGMSVVKRGGVLFLRNLPSRKAHDNKCLFKYMKSLPWLSKQEVLPKEGEVSVMDFSLSAPADLLLALVREAEWLSYDPDFQFLSMIEKVTSVAQYFTVDGECLAKVLKQSAAPLFEKNINPKVSLFISHDIDFSRQTLIRDRNRERQINGGIIPAVALSTIPGGPYLTLVTARLIDKKTVLSSAFIPVSERKCPVPVLSNAERGFAILMKNYANWLNKSEGVSIGFGKVVARVEQLPEGFSIYSGEKIGQVIFTDNDTISLDGGIIKIPISCLENRLPVEQINLIKSKLRKLIS